MRKFSRGLLYLYFSVQNLVSQIRCFSRSRRFRKESGSRLCWTDDQEEWELSVEPNFTAPVLAKRVEAEVSSSDEEDMGFGCFDDCAYSASPAVHASKDHIFTTEMKACAEEASDDEEDMGFGLFDDDEPQYAPISNTKEQKSIVNNIQVATKTESIEKEGKYFLNRCFQPIKI